MIFLGIGLPLFLFVGLAIAIRTLPEGLPWDVPLLIAIHKTSRDGLDHLAVSLTDLGVAKGVFPVMLVVSLVFLYRRHWRSLLYLWLAIFTSAQVNRWIKLLLHRVRPHLWDTVFYPPQMDNAFPSGHAMSSMTLVVVLLVLFWQSRWRWLIVAAGSIYGLTIGWTRLYLGVHYPSDILAGWLAATIWSLFMAVLIKPERDHHSSSASVEETIASNL